MRLLIAGQSGQVARALIECAREAGVEAVALGRPTLDLTRPETLEAALAATRPDIVINAAAYTAVDQAEDEEAIATAVNGTGAGSLAAACAKRATPLLHISTDYVFDGRAATAYAEDDTVAPLGAYGRSKLAGEQAVMAAHPQALIFRTAWVYSPFGKNFVKTMLALAARQDEISVVDDQIGCPTSAHDIAVALLAVSEQLLAGKSVSDRVFHLASTGAASWADVADEVFRVSVAAGGPSARVRRIPSSAFPTRAARPANSRLNCDRLEAGFGLRLPDWHDSLQTCVIRLVANA